eukprot:GHVQ01012432.1.p1 GENE.GHVQ01012432.1~~GHVQ01012432.1.p1  ORF type:complete len:116 (+),score=13.86 GHVQ01012432.1:44-391(+)
MSVAAWVMPTCHSVWSQNYHSRETYPILSNQSSCFFVWEFLTSQTEHSLFPYRFIRRDTAAEDTAREPHKGGEPHSHDLDFLSVGFRALLQQRTYPAPCPHTSSSGGGRYGLQPV